MTADPAHFPPDYATARNGFLAAAEALSAQVASYPIGARDHRGRELAVDVSYLGPESPERVLTISSGIHGVEGFAGSALQHQVLKEQWPGLDVPTDTGLLIVHAINPYGFAELRRVNESNVDLNRNFLEHPGEHAANPGYEELLDDINPVALDEASDEASRGRLLTWAKERGFPALQSALTTGQYVHPKGVQFGGAAVEDSNRILREIAARECRGAAHVAWIDVHTGLGPYGIPEMITELAPEDPAYQRGRAWFGEIVKSTAAGESVSAKLQGVMERGLEQALGPETQLTALAAEFGTYDPIRVFWAMRADNWLEHHGKRDSERGIAVKAELLEVFRPDDAVWFRSVLERGAVLVEQAVAGLASL
ncbi:MAG: M14 family metallopeptidase [Myxococcales bacterium]|nr:M14 family metallopeptidase [Myxococcales bacterium]